MAVREPGAPEFGPEIVGPDFVTPLVTYGLDRVLGLDTRKRSRGRISLRARFGNSKGQFGEPRTISTYADAGSPPSLAGPNGSLVAWIAKSSRGRRIVRAAVKSRGRFRRPVTLRGRGRANDVVAGAAQGVSWVAWERSGVVEARVKRAGRSWGRLQRIGEGAPSATTLATVGSGRRGYLAWIARESAESAFVRAAILPAGGARFLKARTILQGCAPSSPCDYDIGPAPADGEVLRLVAVPDRDALLAWSDGYGAGWRVAAAATDGGSRFSDSFDRLTAGGLGGPRRPCGCAARQSGSRSDRGLRVEPPRRGWRTGRPGSGQDVLAPAASSARPRTSATSTGPACRR